MAAFSQSLAWRHLGKVLGDLGDPLGKQLSDVQKTHRIIEIDALRDRYLRGVPFVNTDIFQVRPPHV